MAPQGLAHPCTLPAGVRETPFLGAPGAGQAIHACPAIALRAVPVTGTGGVGMIGEPVCLKGARPAAGSSHRFHRSFFFMLRIRLTRTGRKKRPSYRVVVAEARWARDGRRIAELGYYDPLTDPFDHPPGRGRHGGLDPQGCAAERPGAQAAGDCPRPCRSRPRRPPDPAPSVCVWTNWLSSSPANLVTEPDAVRVDRVQRNHLSIYKLYVHPSDMGRVIGRQGRVAAGHPRGDARRAHRVRPSAGA